MAVPSDLNALVAALLRLPLERRAEFVEWACGDDQALRQRLLQEVAVRLANSPDGNPDEAENFDERTGVAASQPLSEISRQIGETSQASQLIQGASSDATEDHQSGDNSDNFLVATPNTSQIEFRTGMLIDGRYKLVRSIGEGGMGTVWIAEQFEPVRRQVALKLIKSGVNSSQVVARFAAERQALAVMNHPHIARILDGGESYPAGTPYFVMELVKGVPITSYCDKHRLTLAQRIELFIPVCEAIQHAHQKGILHRDIKPSNILVAEIDGRAVAKVIDFGVAKAIGLALTDKTLNTVVGAVVGTPQYMSPEQADPDFPDIDTRSDVYSLGVLLYELMTGSPPFDAKQLGRAAILEILRVIREVDPPTPSSRLSTDEGLPTISANRGSEPARLPRMVRGELDWIVMKTLEKDRTRRYESASRLADDLRRFLSGEQVLAAPPRQLYRLQKFLRRHRLVVSTVCLVVASLVGALAISSFSLRKARYETRQAEIARESEAEQRKIAEQSRQDEALQRQLAETATQQAFSALQSFSDEFIERRFMSQTYLSPNDRELLNKALQQWQAFSAVQGTTLQALKVQAEGAFRVAKLRQLLGEPEAETGFRDTIRLLNLAIVSAPDDVQLRNSLSDSTVALGKIRLAKGDANEALQLADIGLQSAQKARGLSDSETLQRAEANAQNARAVILRQQQKLPESLAAYQAARELLEPIYSAQKKLDGSEEILANVYNNTGNLLVQLGKFSEAERILKLGLAVRQRSIDENPGDPETREGLGLSHYGLGDLSTRLGEFREALGQYQAALEVFRQLVEDFPQNPTYLVKLANVYSNVSTMQGRTNMLETSLESANHAVEVLSTLLTRFPTFPDAQKNLAKGRLSLALRFEELEQLPAAAEQRQQAIELLRGLVGTPQATASDRVSLAKALLKAGLAADRENKLEIADNMINEGLSIYDALPENLLELQMDRSEGYWKYGMVLLNRSNFEQAEAFFARAIRAIELVINAEPGNIQPRAALRLVLMRTGESYEESTELESAIRYYQKSIKVAEEILQIVPDREDHVLAHAGALNRLALTLGEAQQIEPALQALDASDASLNRFLETHPDSIEAQVLRAGNSVNRYDIGVKQNPTEPQLGLLDSAIESLSQVRLKSPQHRTMLMFMYNALMRRAVDNDTLKRYREAAADWRMLAELPNADDTVIFRSKSAQSLVRGGEVDQAIQIVESLSDVQSAATIFARSRVFALAHEQRPNELYAQRCVDEIQRLIEIGFDDAARLKSDPDLRAVQEFEPFQRLIAKLAGEGEDDK